MGTDRAVFLPQTGFDLKQFIMKLLIHVLCSVGLFQGVTLWAADAKPNVLVILADDLG